jgi:RNA polymerase sigma-70 factor (ECF subfamily)
MTRSDFNILVHQLNRKLYGFAFRILSNQEEAEDAVQEVFIKLWKMEEKLDEYISVDALATTMIKNHCIDQIRKRKRSREEEYKKEDQNYITSVNPQDQMENRESAEIISSIISQLPEGSREIVQLREINDLSYEEIAEKTGQSINTLRVALSRARKLIRDEYIKYHYERKGIETSSRKVL